MQIGHLSATQINMYLKCPMAYYFRYFENLKIPPRAALTRGASFHRATASNYRQKHETHEDMPLQEVLDVFETEFEEMAADTEWEYRDEKAKTKDSGVAVLAEYQKVIAPFVQPIEVECRFNMTFKNRDWSFTGVVDLMDEAETLIETKTSSRTPSVPKIEHVLQTTAYCTGYRARTKKKEKAARIDYAVAKKEPVVVTYPLVIFRADIEYFLMLMDQVAAAIQKEVWIANRTSFLCSRRFCGYFSQCEKQNGGRVRD